MSDSLFPKIDKHNRQFEVAFQKHIKQIKEDNPRLCTQVSELYFFEEEHCAECSKDNGDDVLCPIIGFMAMNGEHEDVLIINEKVVCLKEDSVLQEMRNEFMKGSPDEHNTNTNNRP